MRSLWFTVQLALALLCTTTAPAHAEVVYVAVASNFQPTQEALAKAFTEKTGHTVAATPGATAKLYAQAKNGAPFEVFLSADREHVDRLCAEGAGVGEMRHVYAIGKLALYSAKEPVREGALLKGDAVKHLAIANPAVAPYGAAAVAALKALHLWDALAPRVVQGENIAQAYQFVESGAAEAGFVAWSQVLKSPADRVWLLPQELYPPLVQEAVLLLPGKDKPAAAAYMDFLKSDAARALIAATGYALEP